MDLRTRKILLSSLLCAFLIQTTLVYWDQTGSRTPPLSESAQIGQEIWLSHNCQSCHQMYGFGGFLGPDLTNAAKRLTPERSESILQFGSPQMPAYHFNSEERASLLSFFQEVDKTGKGTPSIHKDLPSDPIQHFNVSANTFFKDREEVRRGLELMHNYACISCHLPNTQSIYKAPDLTTVTARLSKEEISKVLVEGRIEKGMPPFQMPESDRESVIQLLSLLNTERESFLNMYGGTGEKISVLDFFRKLPWFEYE